MYISGYRHHHYDRAVNGNDMMRHIFREGIFNGACEGQICTRCNGLTAVVRHDLLLMVLVLGNVCVQEATTTGGRETSNQLLFNGSLSLLFRPLVCLPVDSWAVD